MSFKSMPFKALSLAVLLGLAPVVTANPLQQGAGALLYGRCQVDVLTPDRMQMAASMAALSPAALGRVAPAPDEMAQIQQMCAHQIHQHRCSQKIVKIAGSAITKQNPAGKVAPPSANPGAVFGGVAGAVTGGLLGNRRDTGTAVVGAAAGAWGGAKLGGKIYDATDAGLCVTNKATLDAIADRLQGSVRQYSAQGMLDLIELNRQQRVISDSEAEDLNAEIQRLAVRAQEVLRAAR